MKAKTFLDRAYRLDLRINTKLEQLEHLRSLAYKVTTIIREDKVQGGGQPKGALEDAVIKIIMAEQATNDEVDRFIAVKNEIMDMLRFVINEDQRLLLEMRYLCFNSWEQIAVKLHISCSYGYQLHRQALDSFDSILLAQGRYTDV